MNSGLPQEQSINRQGRILVAEDDTVSRKLVNRMLHNNDYEVLLARDGEEAVAMYDSHSDIVLILMDDDESVQIIGLSACAMKGETMKKELAWE